MTPEEALTQIRALCDEADRLGDQRRRALTSGQVRAVLDAVSVDATPAQGIDRASLADRIESAISLAFEAEGEAWSDRLSGDRLARVARRAIEDAGLVRPVEGVEMGRIRRILLDSLPADPKWMAWVDGVLDRIFSEGDES